MKLDIKGLIILIVVIAAAVIYFYSRGHRQGTAEASLKYLWQIDTLKAVNSIKPDTITKRDTIYKDRHFF